MTMKPMQNRAQRLVQAWRRRHAALEDAVAQFRHRRAGDPKRRARRKALFAAMEATGMALRRRLHGLGAAARGLQNRIRLGLHSAGRHAAPLQILAVANSKRVHDTRVRWWDPIYLRLQPYLKSRRKGELLRGLPALVAILIIASAVAIVTGARPAATRNATLLREAQMALSGKEYAKAAITYERLLQVGGNDNDARYGLARCWAAMGESQQAALLLSALAPDNAAGYLPAHRVRAFLILQAPAASTDDLEIARQHLDRVLAADPDDSEAHGMLGTLFLRQNRIREARDQFALAAGVHPETALNAAMLSRQLGEREAMMDFASKAAAFNRGSVKTAGIQVPAETVLSLAQALCLQKKYGDAVDTIEELLGRSDRDRLVKAIMEICRAWQSDLDARSGAQDLERFRLVNAALRFEPASHDWQVRLLALGAEGSVVRPVAVQLLAKLAQDNAAGAEVCFFLGMDAWSRGDMPVARRFLERSLALKPGHAPTANNLACALLTGRNQDPARALEYADQAVAAAPGNPMYRETRGEALLALQRWSEAAAELERALPGLPARRDAYQCLAIAYENLGLREKAREQQRLAANDRPN